MQPTSRANAAMAIALRQLQQARQQDQTSSDEDLVENLTEVPGVIKDFLKKKILEHRQSQGSSVANLQNDNPLYAQQRIYNDVVERLTRPYRPQMSFGRPVGGNQLPPEQALNVLHQDEEFHGLPAEYQQYVMGVVGGQGALDLHGAMQTELKNRSTLANKARGDALSFSESPTRMVQDNLEKGKWFVDPTKRQLMKREKNPVSGLDEVAPLNSWEIGHAVNEAPRLGYGDFGQYLNPAQQAGMAALKANPKASIADIVSMVKSGNFANLQKDQRPMLNGVTQDIDAERLSTMKMLYPQAFEGQQPQPQDAAPLFDAPRHAFHQPSPSAGIVAGERARSLFLSGASTGENFAGKVAPFIAASGQNLLSGVSRANNWLYNFGQGAGLPVDNIPAPVVIPPTTTQEKQKTFRDFIKENIYGF